MVEKTEISAPAKQNPEKKAEKVAAVVVKEKKPELVENKDGDVVMGISSSKKKKNKNKIKGDKKEKPAEDSASTTLVGNKRVHFDLT